jgi:RHS repeat-associated protein
MNVSYSYQASAGQMGAGSTAGNAGQLTSLSGTINGTTESGAYTYDNLGRLATSSQTSNGLSAQRRLAYDRWGNRTGVWDATSGGNQIQSVALQQSGGAPTNQIQSVTAGPTFTYAYDSAGNVTNDGIHSYTYDGANRMVSVDGGVTATYAYDQQNQRVKKVSGGSTTHYVFEGSQAIAEHDGSTGALIADSIYSGTKLIAKMTGKSIQYFVSDRMSTRLVLDASGSILGRQGHLPFGEDFAGIGSQEKHQFTSYERDSESGTDYAVNRVYSPSLGRFLSADPYSPGSSIRDPRGWNRYSYTRNVVINRADPLGLSDGPIEGGCRPDAGGSYPGKCLCVILPELCPGGLRPGYPPNEDGNSDGGRGSEEESPFKGLTVSVSWKIPSSSKSPQGELATCGKFDLTVRIKNVPEGNPKNIFVSEVKAGNYPDGSIRLVGQESYRQTGKTLEYNATYQVGNIIGYQRTGNLGLKIILGARVKSGPDEPIHLVTTDVNRLGHEDDYIAIRGIIRGGSGGFKDCPN